MARFFSSPLHFSEKYHELKNRQLLAAQAPKPQAQEQTCRSAEAEAQHAHKLTKGQVAAIYRYMALWKLHDRSLSLVGVVKPSQDIARTPDDKALALGSYWQGIFNKLVSDYKALKAFCDQHVPSWSLELPLLSRLAFEVFLKLVRDSSPGSDGLPYSAWAAVVETSSCTLHELALWMSLGNRLSLDFGDSLGAFLGKGSHPEDNDGLIRTPECTRPLNMKNTDNKTIGGVINLSARKPVSTKLCTARRGFKSGDQIGDNIIELDSRSRVFSWKFNCPILALLDISQAFPSLLHAWLFCVGLGAFRRASLISSWDCTISMFASSKPLKGRCLCISIFRAFFKVVLLVAYSSTSQSIPWCTRLRTWTEYMVRSLGGVPMIAAA